MAVVSDAQRLFPSVTLRFLVKPALFQKTLRVDDARERAAARPRLTWAASPWWGPLTSGRRGPSAQRVQSQAWAAGTLVTEPGVASARPEAWGLPSSPRPAPRRAAPHLVCHSASSLARSLRASLCFSSSRSFSWLARSRVQAQVWVRSRGGQ